jgi:hypothetical protein
MDGQSTWSTSDKIKSGQFQSEHGLMKQIND